MKSALWRGRGYLGRTNAERNDRYAKQSAPAVHISIRFQSEGQFNCGGRPTRPSAIFSASNRPPETVNVCARAPPNDIYIYIDTVLERVLEQRPTLKCICGAGLTTNFKFFPARSACTDTHKPIPTLAEWREHGFPPSCGTRLSRYSRQLFHTSSGWQVWVATFGLFVRLDWWCYAIGKLVMRCTVKLGSNLVVVEREAWRGKVSEKWFRIFLVRNVNKAWEERIKLWEGISSLIFSLCKRSKGKKIKVIEGQ